MHRPPDQPRSAAKLRIALLVAFLAAMGVGLVVQASGVTRRLEQDTVDVRFQAHPFGAPTDVVMVAVDDISFSRLGQRWPWSRRLHARMVDDLTARGAKVIVYDVQFTERSTRDPEQDLALYDAVARSRRTVLATTEMGEGGTTNVLGGDDNLRAANARAGAANFSSDAGDVIRRMPYAVGGLKSLAVVAAERATGRPVTASWFPAGEAWIAYSGPPGTVPTYSFSDVLRGRVPRDAFRGKVVVVGATAPSLQDMHPTPTSDGQPMSGPEVQANAIQTILDGLPLRPAPGWLVFACIAVLALAPTATALSARLAVALAVSLAAGALFVVAAFVAFSEGTLVNVTAPLTTLVGAIAFATLARYLAETRERRRFAWYSQILEQQVAERTAELRLAQLEVVQRLGQAADWREAETGRHIERVGRLCEALAVEIGIPPQEAEVIKLAAALHDIGKIGIPDAVLLKEGPLDADEWVTMRGHTTIGGDILSGSRSPLMNYAEQIARTHHEHWNGNGYPNGISGTEIPITGRICAICDVFDALLSRRSYKAAWPLEAVVAELRELAGRQFDPDLVEAFARIAPRMHEELEYAVHSPVEERAQVT